MLNDEISFVNTATSQTHNYKKLANGQRVSDKSLPGLSETLVIRHTETKANKKTGTPASRRSNVHLECPVKDSVTGVVAMYSVDVTINKSDLNNDQINSPRTLATQSFAEQLLQGGITSIMSRVSNGEA